MVRLAKLNACLGQNEVTERIPLEDGVAGLDLFVVFDENDGAVGNVHLAAGDA